MNIFRYVKIYLTFCWMLLIYVIISHPFPDVPNPHPVWTWYDKGIHLTLYFVLALLILESLRDFAKNQKIVSWATFIFCFLYAVFNEYVQAFVPGREISEFDFAASLLGTLMAIGYGLVIHYRFRNTVLLHICCIGCGAYVSRVLESEYKVRLFFYNPNIFPKEEYERRLEETKEIAKQYKLPLEVGVYNHGVWLRKVRGLENEPERGRRCDKCYLDRLEKTAKKAKRLGIPYFATTLSVSPHKSAEKLNEIGSTLEKKYRLKYLSKDFKKNDGFKKAAQLSRELGVYRQNYCGCEFSIRGVEQSNK